VRAVITSHLYADPANRAKLRSLAGLGVTLAVAVPDQWTGGDGTTRATEAGDDAGVQVVPIPVRGPLDQPGGLRWNPKALLGLLADYRPDLLHI
jgi:hypothetical protein